MSEVIAIVAPSEWEGDCQFVVRMQPGGRELTLQNLHRLAKAGFDMAQFAGDPSCIDGTIPAAGYYLSGALRAAGYDTLLTQHTDEATLRKIAAASPRAVCISSTMLMSRASLAHAVARVRHVMPDVCVIVGGILVWKSYRWREISQHVIRSPSSPTNEEDWFVLPCTKDDIDADVFVVSPHGLDSLFAVLKELDRGSHADLAHVPNLFVPNLGGEFIPTPRASDQILDEDFTRWDLLDELPVRIPIRTSMGCAYRCAFCDFCSLFPQLTLRSLESLKAELRLIATLVRSHRRRPVLLDITDDNVFVSRQRLREICKTLIDAKTGMMWGSFVRAASFVCDEVDLAKRSGLVLAMIGVESGHQAQLDRMGKKQRTDTVRLCIETLDAKGIGVLMTFLVGFPGETSETVEATTNFLTGLQVCNSSYRLYPLWVSPLSSLASPSFRTRWQLEGGADRWSHQTMNSEQAQRFCFEVFRHARNVPYGYPEESGLYNRGFAPERRRQLFDLRRQLTVQLIEGQPWESIVDTLCDIKVAMGLERTPPPATFRDHLYIPKAAMLAAGRL
jgi:radical SAM superfamily enzyme YgiQ (UPF0313 family)